MFESEFVGVFGAAIALGAVHGVEPGHGWPVAASYALDQTNKWLYGFAASAILGVGHLVSSIAMVAVFFWAKSYFALTQVNEPITVLGWVELGGPVSLVAGVLLVALGIREYRHGHSHGHGDGHSHGHSDGHSHGHGDGHSHGHGDDHSHGHGDDGAGVSQVAADVNAMYGDEASDNGGSDGHAHDDGHSHGHDEDAGGVLARLAGRLPFVGGSRGHAHDHGDLDGATDRGLWGIAWFAFVLGFAHEEEFEIIALCAGSTYCLELMTAYALTVIVGIVALTLLLIAGYERSEERVQALTPYLPAFSAAVLVAMGVGFVLGVF